MTGRAGLAARWLVDVDVQLVTAAHLGDGEEGDVVDQEVLRGADGGPVAWGTSVAGLLREALCLGVLGDRVAEPKIAKADSVAALFGSASGTDDGIDSALVIDDAPGELPDGLTAEIRDGVAITPSTRIARDYMLYDWEVWPPGTRFTFRLELPIDRGDSAQQEAELLAGLAFALELVDRGAVGLGARTTRGLGELSLGATRAQRFDLTTQQGWDAWFEALLDDRRDGGTGRPMPAPRCAPRPADALHAALDAARQDHFTTRLEALRDQRRDRRLQVEIPVEFPSGVLIRRAEATGPDVSHVRSGNKDVLTGTAIAGSLRQRARRIAHVVRAGKADADDWVVALFGSEPERDGAPPAPGTPKPVLDASRLRIDETYPSGGKRLVVTRVRIDSFTQAPVRSALFQEEVLYGARPSLRLTLPLTPPPDTQPGNGSASRFDDALCGFVLLLVKDVLLGDLAIGGTSAVGRGWASPRRDVQLRVERDGAEVLAANVEDLFETGVPPEAANEIDRWVQAFGGADSLDTQEQRP